MVEVKTKDNEQDYRYIRIEVFMKEQEFQNEFDEIDATAVYITVYVDDTLASCARYFLKEEGAAWVSGRIAVLPQFRRQGLGGVLLSEMESIVRSKKERCCILDAQCHVCAFYEGYDYTICGEEHVDEHVLHVQMEKLLWVGVCFAGCDGNSVLDLSGIRGKCQGKGALIKDMQEVIDGQPDVKCTDHACTLRGCSTISAWETKADLYLSCKGSCPFLAMQSILPCAEAHAVSHTILHTDTGKITDDGMGAYYNHFRIHSPRMLNI